MKTVHAGNAHKPSKAVRTRREFKRLVKKFGPTSDQVKWFVKSHPSLGPM